MLVIIIKLNEKGKKICGVNNKTILVHGNSEPNTKEINEAIAKEFIPELVEEIVSVDKTFEDVIQSGDIVKVCTNESVFFYAKVLNVFKSGSYKGIEVIQIDGKERCYSIRFDLFGKEIYGSCKHKRYLEIPTAEEISYVNELIHKEESYNYIVSNIYDDTYGECPDFLTVDDITKIKEIVSNAKNKYAEENGLSID